MKNPTSKFVATAGGLVLALSQAACVTPQANNSELIALPNAPEAAQNGCTVVKEAESRLGPTLLVTGAGYAIGGPALGLGLGFLSAFGRTDTVTTTYCPGQGPLVTRDYE